MSKLTLQQIERAADNYLSSFGGLSEYPDGFEGDFIDHYTGEGDELLSFGGATSFADVDKSDRQFNLIIANATAANQDILLFPGILGLQAGGRITDGNINAGEDDFTCEGSPSSVDEFLAFVQRHPHQLAGMKITSHQLNAEGPNNVPSQMNNPLIVSPFSPYKTLESRNIHPGNASDQYVVQNNIVVFNTPQMVVGSDLKVTYRVMRNTSVAITMYFGALMNDVAALDAKARRAQSNISRMGLNRVRKNQNQRRKGLKS